MQLGARVDCANGDHRDCSFLGDPGCVGEGLRVDGSDRWFVDDEDDIEAGLGEACGQRGASRQRLGTFRWVLGEDRCVTSRDAWFGGHVPEVALGADCRTGGADRDASDVLGGPTESVKQFEGNDELAGAGRPDHLDRPASPHRGHRVDHLEARGGRTSVGSAQRWRRRNLQRGIVDLIEVGGVVGHGDLLVEVFEMGSEPSACVVETFSQGAVAHCEQVRKVGVRPARQIAELKKSTIVGP